MINITVKELAEKLNKLLKNNGDIDLGAAILAAAVIGESDPDFPPGTIIFDCKSKKDGEESDHVLSIYPTKLGKLQ